MNTYVNQYPAALYSCVSEFGYRTERYTGEALRSGRANRAARQRSLLGWLRPASRSRERREPARPAPSPHHYELKYQRGDHAAAR